MAILLWLRSDLRTQDNPALYYAAQAAEQQGLPLVACFNLCVNQWRQHDWGTRRIDFLLAHLAALRAELSKLNIPLLLISTDSFRQTPKKLQQLAGQLNIKALYFNREYEINERTRDDQVIALFNRDQRICYALTDQTLIEPGQLVKNDGSFYAVFTPFKRKWLSQVERQCWYHYPSPAARPTSNLKLPNNLSETSAPLPKPSDASQALFALWPIGATAAQQQLEEFSQQSLADYHQQRDFPAQPGTSRLSPYLAVGALSIRQCLSAASAAMGGQLDSSQAPGPSCWVSELIWREFYKHILVGFPRVCRYRAFKVNTEQLPWRDSDADLKAWQNGLTGYPLVDAAMRQLNQTGWMHNRLRMVSAMFLSKHLFLDWRLGERYFMQQLLDADLAANNGGWQWSASTGVDAAPYFRMFNPTEQSKKFDPDGAFIRQYVPELADLPTASLHAPSPLEANSCGYPLPIVEHKAAREKVMRAFKQLSGEEQLSQPTYKKNKLSSKQSKRKKSQSQSVMQPKAQGQTPS